MKFSLILATTALLTACIGSGNPAPPASSLAYVDPPPGGFRWVANRELSTPGRLVLDLEGPGAGEAGRGVVFTLRTDPGAVAFTAPAGGGLVENVAFDLGEGVQLARHEVRGGTLQAGLFQKGPGHAPPLAGTLCRVALAPVPGLAAGRTLSLAAVATRTLPAAGAQLQDWTCSVGILTTR